MKERIGLHSEAMLKVNTLTSISRIQIYVAGQIFYYRPEDVSFFFQICNDNNFLREQWALWFLMIPRNFFRITAAYNTEPFGVQWRNYDAILKEPSFFISVGLQVPDLWGVVKGQAHFPYVLWFDLQQENTNVIRYKK